MDFSKIKVLVFDVDGTLTDGKLYYGAEHIIRAFNVKDGLSVKRAQALGYNVIFLTSAPDYLSSKKRSADLRVDLFYTDNKLKTVEEICSKLRVSLENIFYIGDDVNDLEVMAVAGKTACPRDSVIEVRRSAQITLNANGGEGVAREVVELLTSQVTGKVN